MGNPVEDYLNRNNNGEEVKVAQETPKTASQAFDEMGVEARDLIPGLGLVNFLQKNYEELAGAWKRGRAIASTYDERDDVFDLGSAQEALNAPDSLYEAYEEAVASNQQVGSGEDVDAWMASVSKNLKEGENGFMAAVLATREHGIGALAQVSLQSIAQGTNKRVVGEALPITGAGLAGGLAFGGASALATTPAAFMAGTNYAVETIATFDELLAQELKNQNLEFNAENIRAVMSNDESRSRIKRQARQRGVTIGMVEGVTSLAGVKGAGAVTKRVGDIAKLTGKAKKGVQALAGGTVAAASEIAGGSAGEYLGAKAAGMDASMEDIIIEGAAGFGTAPVTATAGAAKVVLSKAKYTLDGESVSKDVLMEYVDGASPQELASMKIEIKNDDITTAEIQEKAITSVIESQLPTNITNTEERAKLVELEKQFRALKGKETVAAEVEKSKIKKQIKDIVNKYEGVEADVTLEETKKEVQDAKLQRNIKFAEEGAKDIGRDSKVFETTEEALTYAMEQGMSEDQANELAGADGFFVGKDNILVVNKEVARQKGAISVGSHELFHGIIGNSFKKLNPKEKSKLVKSFGDVMTKSQRSVVEKRILDNYNENNKYNLDLTKSIFDDSNINKWMESGDETFTVFSDGIELGQIQFDEGVFSKLKNVIQELLRKVGINKEFQNGRQVYNFLKDYNKSVTKGKLSERQKEFAKKDFDMTEIDARASYTKTDRDKRIDAIGEKSTKAEWDAGGSDRAISDMYMSGDLEAIVRNNLSSDLKNLPNYSEEDFISETIGELMPHIKNFNIDRKETQSGFGLSGWIRGQISNKIGNVLKKKKATTETFTVDTTDEKVKETVESTDDLQDLQEEDLSIAAQTKKKAKAERREEKGMEEGVEYSTFRRALKVKGKQGLSDNIVDNVKQAVVKTMATERTTPDSDKFIANIKKSFLTELKKPIQDMMGKKDDFTNFLKTNREAIIAALPTSTLVQMERNVDPADRVFTVEVKRNLNPTETDEAIANNLLPKDTNRTSGPTLYNKRMPSEGEFLRYFSPPLYVPSKKDPNKFVRSGLKGTRKDTLAEQMGIELAFDATMEVVQSPDVAERRALVTSTEFGKAELAKLAKTIDRGVDVKFSRSNPAEVRIKMDLALDNVNTDAYLDIRFSKSSRDAYIKRLVKNRPDLKGQEEQYVDSVFDWLETTDIKKRSKYEKMAMHYMAKGYLILPEDGYKVVEAERLAAIKKIDPFSVGNPNDIIEKYAGTVKGARTNPDTVKEFSNKKDLGDGVVTYDVEQTKEGQLAVRKVIDTHFGKKSNPWCLAARSNRAAQEYGEFDNLEEADRYVDYLKERGYETEVFHMESDGTWEVYGDLMLEPNSPRALDEAFIPWKNYQRGGKGYQIVFTDGKLSHFRDGSGTYWDRLDDSSDYIPKKLNDLKLEDGFTQERELNVNTGEEVLGKKTKTTGNQQDGTYTNITIENNEVGDGKVEQVTGYDEVYDRINDLEESGYEVSDPEVVQEGENDTTVYEIQYFDPRATLETTYKAVELKEVRENGKLVFQKKLTKYPGESYGTETKYSGDSMTVTHTQSHPEGLKKGGTNRLELEKDLESTGKVAGVNLKLDKYTETTFVSDYKKTPDGGYDRVGSKHTVKGELNGKDTTIEIVDSVYVNKDSNITKVKVNGKTVYTAPKVDNTGIKFSNSPSITISAKQKAERLTGDMVTQMDNLLDAYEKSIIDGKPNDVIIVDRDKKGKPKSFTTKTPIKKGFENKNYGSNQTAFMAEFVYNLYHSNKYSRLYDKKTRDKMAKFAIALQKKGKKGYDLKPNRVHEMLFIRLMGDSFGDINSDATVNRFIEEGGKGDVYVTLGKNSVGLEIKMDEADGVSQTAYPTIDKNGNFTLEFSSPNKSVNGKKSEDALSEAFNESMQELQEILKGQDLGITSRNIEKNKNGKNRLVLDEAQTVLLRSLGYKTFAAASVAIDGQYIESAYAGKDQGFIQAGNKLFFMETGDSKLDKSTNAIVENAKKLGLNIPRFQNEAGPNDQPSSFVATVGITNFDKREDGKFNITIRTAPKILSKNLAKSDVNLLKKSDMKTIAKAINEELVRVNNMRLSKTKSKAMELGQLTNKDTEAVGMSTFDFDETLIIDGENFITATKGDDVVKITSSQWPLVGDTYAAEGYTFDFSDFVNVRGGVDGPLLQKMKNQISKYGVKNVFVLTARPAESATAIQGWLESKGINIPLENITGLGNSSGNAKAQWMLDKFAEGYNDMYFVDDALPNVKAVKNVLDQLDIKSDVQQAKIKFSKTASKKLNDMIERKKGIDSDEIISSAAARRKGENVNKFQIFVPPTAEDFSGLLYYFAGKGKQGDADLAFMKEFLLDPLSRGERDIAIKKQSLIRGYNELKNNNKEAAAKIKEMAGDTPYTKGTAVRVYLWNQDKTDIPGLSDKEVQELVDIVKNDPELIAYADGLRALVGDSEGKYITPSNDWVVETIAKDLQDATSRVGRKKFLAEFIENADAFFSKDNLNKMEAAYGKDFRESLEDMLYRIKTGQNRPSGTDASTKKWMNWLNNSVGAIMFFNTKSAVLQLMSTVNYLNWSDNNFLLAGKAFANQKQFWSDFSMLWNSDFLKQRRSGLSTDINEAEIASAAAGAKNKATAVLAYLLKKGFLPTQIADSFAISSGGAAFYRNRVNSYVKQGMDQKAAEEKAMTDFREITEENQQSSRPDRISKQQASPLGRVILAFQNTPMQYARIIKKSVADIVAGRGDLKTHVSKIIFYGGVQSLIFGAMQNALFALAFDDEEDDKKLTKTEQEKKQKKRDTQYERTLNTMLDSLLNGSGLTGRVLSTVKNVIFKFLDEKDKGWNSDMGNVAIEAANISPPLGSKLRKMKKAGDVYDWNQKVIDEMDTFDVNNPIWEAGANVIEATTNVPAARAIKKLESIREAFNQNNETWQRIAVAMGWSQWDLGIEGLKKQAVQGTKEYLKKKKKDEKAKSKKPSSKKRTVKKSSPVDIYLNRNKPRKNEASKVQGGKYRCTALTQDLSQCKNRTDNSSKKCFLHN